MLKAFASMTVLAASLAIPFATSASALPMPGMDAPDPNIIQIYGGCGVYGHRGPFGGCRPGGQAGGYVPGRSCPRGFHIGRFGRHCLPNW